jgi:hypothetical protein
MSFKGKGKKGSILDLNKVSDLVHILTLPSRSTSLTL